MFQDMVTGMSVIIDFRRLMKVGDCDIGVFEKKIKNGLSTLGFITKMLVQKFDDIQLK